MRRGGTRNVCAADGTGGTAESSTVAWDNIRVACEPADRTPAPVRPAVVVTRPVWLLTARAAVVSTDAADTTGPVVDTASRLPAPARAPDEPAVRPVLDTSRMLLPLRVAVETICRAWLTTARPTACQAAADTILAENDAARRLPVPPRTTVDAAAPVLLDTPRAVVPVRAARETAVAVAETARRTPVATRPAAAATAATLDTAVREPAPARVAREATAADQLVLTRATAPVESAALAARTEWDPLSR